MEKISSVDQYMIDGCMRCKYGATPQCKVNTWRDELVQLRSILLSMGLDEAVKWNMPCYTVNGKNCILLSAFKEFCSLNFFHGGQLAENHPILQKQGENAEASRIIKITSVESILEREDEIRAAISAAIALQNSGMKVKKEPAKLVLPEELTTFFLNDKPLESAFYQLTPGRQKGYVLHFSQAKKSETRVARIEKSREKIMKGLGFHD